MKRQIILFTNFHKLARIQMFFLSIVKTELLLHVRFRLSRLLTESGKCTKILTEMYKNFSKIMVLMIALAIALLPLRFGHAAEVDVRATGGELNSSHLHTHGHDPDENRHTPDSHNEYSPVESVVDDCCGDQCSGAQILITSAFNFYSTFLPRYDLAWSQHLPDPIASAKYRPPIRLS